jgi:hypothetical protein
MHQVPVASSVLRLGSWLYALLAVSAMTRAPSSAPNPRDVVAKAMAQIDRSLLQRQPHRGGPKFKLIAVTAAAMA